MNLNKLTEIVISVNHTLRSRAKSAVNMSLTVRNWLVGYYIVEYEQHGEDRAKYGDKLLKTLADSIKERGVDGFSFRNLNLYRQFYNYYPEIWQALAAKPGVITKNGIMQTVSAQLDKIIQSPDKLLIQGEHEIVQTVPAQSPTGSFPANNSSYSEEQIKLAAKMLQSLSFSHIILLLPLENNLKRAFYTIEAIKGVWSVRELKRQINSLFFERSGLSTNKEKLSKLINQATESENNVQTLRNPMVFEFLGLPTNETLEESQLEKALMDNLQHFLLELGFGFCFEARQKRILIDDEYFYIDLVFYHRILKCHVLVELKTEEFTHENMGQLNVYLQYYKEKEMQPTDNPPVGILLCTKSKPQMVHYATTNKENLLVSEYRLKLPKEQELQEFVEKQITRI